MTTLRDAAATAYQDKTAAARTALITAAQNALVPVFTDAANKLYMDPTKTTTAAYVDQAGGVVVLTTTDGSNLSFQVTPAVPVVYVATGSGAAWTVIAPAVKDLDDVGQVLAAHTGV